MLDQRKISIAIPTWNRSEMTIESFIGVYNDERVSEIIIVDDASDMEVFEDLKSMTDALPKVRLYRNGSNCDCYRNKMNAVSFVTKEWCVLLDSDNKIDKTYLDILFEIEEWDNHTIYTPSFAKPHFDFRSYDGMTITKQNVAEWIDKPMAEVCLNAANYFINTLSWLSVWDGEVDPVTSDSILQCYNWLNSGYKIKIVKGLHYEHSVHDGSHYKNNCHRTEKGFHEKILDNLRNMK